MPLQRRRPRGLQVRLAPSPPSAVFVVAIIAQGWCSGAGPSRNQPCPRIACSTSQHSPMATVSSLMFWEIARVSPAKTQLHVQNFCDVEHVPYAWPKRPKLGPEPQSDSNLDQKHEIFRLAAEKLSNNRMHAQVQIGTKSLTKSYATIDRMKTMVYRIVVA